MTALGTDGDSPAPTWSDRTPTVSVGLPIYNGERYLESALRSLLAQTFEDFELVISDNASTDRTEEICRDFLATDPRVRYHRNHKNIGGSPNHNRVRELSRGRYFMWASDDDLRAPTYLERCLDILEENPNLVICYTKTQRIDEHGQGIPSYVETDLDVGALSPAIRFAEVIQLGHILEPILGLIRSSALSRTRPEGSFADSDRVLLAELACLGPFYRISETLFFRRDHPGRSVRLYPTRQGRIAWSVPDKRGGISFPYWRELREFMEVLWRAPIDAVDRRIAYRHLFSWAMENRRFLRHDVEEAIRTLAREFLRGRPAQ